MKKTLTININGTVFHIDEDAYAKLQNYLQTLTRHYKNTEEGKEIVSDIEARVGEIFSEEMTAKGGVVDLKMVEKMIGTLGKPEEIFETTEEEEPPTAAKKSKKTYYRDADRRIIGGVASGLAAYLGMDVLVMRLIIFILALISAGTVILIYLILWIVVPKAATTAQKLAMRGEPINISNIERSVKEEYAEVKESFSQLRDNSSTTDNVRRFVDFITDVLRILLKVILIIIGAALLAAGLIGFVSLLGSLLFANTIITPDAHHHLGFIFESFLSGGNLFLFGLGILLIAGIPLLFLAFVGSKILFKYKSNNLVILLTGIALWIAGFILLATTSLGEAKQFMAEGTAPTETYTLQTNEVDTLYVETAKEENYEYVDDEIVFVNISEYEVVEIDGEKKILGYPKLSIVKNKGEDFELKFKKEARGNNIENAETNAKGIHYNWEQNDSLLVLDKHFSLKESIKWRVQELDLVLKIPVGKVIYIDESLDDIIYEADNVNNFWEQDMLENMWVMTEDGLELVSK